MLRISLILVIGLVSCGQTKNRKLIVTDVVIDSAGLPLDILNDTKSAFHWRKWEKPNPKHVCLSDDILKHVAKGHVKIDGSYGDINENGILDLIIITGLANEDSLRSTSKELPRHMLVFLDQKDFTFRNNKAIPCTNCCGQADPYAGHLATTGKFIIRENCITDKKYRSEYQFAFAPKENDWFLDTIITESSALNDEKYTLDTLTKKDFGKLSLRTFVMSNIKANQR